MLVNNRTPKCTNPQAFTARTIFVPRALNKASEHLYMFNDVSDLTGKLHKPSVINNEGVLISNICENLIEGLKNLGLKFIEKEVP